LRHPHPEFGATLFTFPTRPSSPLSLLNDPSLLKTDALIDGQWITAPAASPCTTRPPAKLADVANLGPQDAQAAIAAANAAWPAWRSKTAKERSHHPAQVVRPAHATRTTWAAS
jgi:hypothetical protein